MSSIAPEEAFRVLAKWSEEKAAIHVAMSRSAMKIGGQRAASAAIVNQALPHSQKLLLTLRDENGDDVALTVSLEGAKWERGAGWLAASFPNGNCYVFGERAEAVAE